MRLEQRNIDGNRLLLEITHMGVSLPDGVTQAQSTILPPRMVVRFKDIESLSIAESGNVHYLFLRSGRTMVVTFAVATQLRNLLADESEMTVSVHDNRSLRLQRHNPPSNARYTLLFIILSTCLTCMVLLPFFTGVSRHYFWMIAVPVILLSAIVSHRLSKYFVYDK